MLYTTSESQARTSRTDAVCLREWYLNGPAQMIEYVRHGQCAGTRILHTKFDSDVYTLIHNTYNVGEFNAKECFDWLVHVNALK